MEKFEGNGMTPKGFTNSHVSYRDKSIVVDYERCLHADFTYEHLKDNQVLCEVYPIISYYDTDDERYMCGEAIVFEVNTDGFFGKADIAQIMAEVDRIINEHEHK